MLARRVQPLLRVRQRGDGAWYSFSNAHDQYARDEEPDPLAPRNEYGKPVERKRGELGWPGRRTSVQLYAPSGAATRTAHVVRRAANEGTASASEALPF